MSKRSYRNYFKRLFGTKCGKRAKKTVSLQTHCDGIGRGARTVSDFDTAWHLSVGEWCGNRAYCSASFPLRPPLTGENGESLVVTGSILDKQRYIFGGWHSRLYLNNFEQHTVGRNNVNIFCSHHNYFFQYSEYIKVLFQFVQYKIQCLKFRWKIKKTDSEKFSEGKSIMNCSNEKMILMDILVGRLYFTCPITDHM